MRIPGKFLPVLFTGAAIAVSAVAIIPAGSNASSSLVPTGTVLKQERLISTCMQAKGFQYTPSLPKDVLQEQALQEALAAGEDPGAALTEAAESAPANPNDAYTEALAPKEQKAYLSALWGTDTAPGCSESTFAKAWGVSPESLAAVGEDHHDQVAGDARVIAAQGVYENCMAGVGYPVTGVDDIYRVAGLRAEVASEDEGRRILDTAYAAHDTCFEPYRTTFNAVDLEFSAAS